MENNETQQNNFFASKLNTLLLLILIIVMMWIVLLLINDRKDNSPVQNSVVTNENMSIYSNVLEYKANEDVPITDNTPLAGMHIFGISDENPGSYSYRFVIIASKIKNKINKPFCGDLITDPNSKGNGPCSIFVVDTTGEIIKKNEWPNHDIATSNPELLYLDYVTDNTVEFFGDTVVEFKTIQSSDCDSNSNVITWIYDIGGNYIRPQGQVGNPKPLSCD